MRHQQGEVMVLDSPEKNKKQDTAFNLTAVEVSEGALFWQDPILFQLGRYIVIYQC